MAGDRRQFSRGVSASPTRHSHGTIAGAQTGATATRHPDLEVPRRRCPSLPNALSENLRGRCHVGHPRTLPSSASWLLPMPPASACDCVPTTGRQPPRPGIHLRHRGRVSPRHRHRRWRHPCGGPVFVSAPSPKSLDPDHRAKKSPPPSANSTPADRPRPLRRRPIHTGHSPTIGRILPLPMAIGAQRGGVMAVEQARDGQDHRHLWTAMDSPDLYVDLSQRPNGQPQARLRRCY